MNLKQAERKARKLWGDRGVVTVRCGERVVGVLCGEGHVTFLDVKGVGRTYAAAFGEFERTERRKAFAATARYCQLCEVPFEDKDATRPVWLLTEHQDTYVCRCCHDRAKFGRLLKPNQRHYVYQMQKALNPDVAGLSRTYHLRNAESSWAEMTQRDRGTVAVLLRNTFNCPVHDDPFWEEREEKYDRAT